MFEKLQITQQQFNKARQYNNSLATIFDKMKTNKKGYYRIT